MNFYSFHPGDYTLRTAHLEPLEDLAYRRLLDLYYLNEGPLAGTPDELARVIRMRQSADEVKAVLEEFFQLSEVGWQHSHCDEVIAKYHAKAKQAATNGKAGGRPKKPSDNPEETQPVISGLPEKSESKTNQEPETNNQEPEDQEPCAPSAHAPAAGVELFDRFWKLYPRKQDKAKAAKAFAKLKVTDDLFNLIAKGLTAQAASHDWIKDNGKFVPMPTTWLNGKRWEDEVAPAGNVHHLPNSRHHGFEDRDYFEGLTEREDGTYAL